MKTALPTLFAVLYLVLGNNAARYLPHSLLPLACYLTYGGLGLLTTGLMALKRRGTHPTPPARWMAFRLKLTYTTR